MMVLHRKASITLLCTFLWYIVVSGNQGSEETKSQGRQPNIVFFLVDDLGIGDIGCFGNDTIKTPNIDRLASLGAKLNHNLAPASLCTPSRAATLTGRYAIRSGMADNHNRVLVHLGKSGGLPTNETTFGKVLQKAGYKTSMIGKWHLGLNCDDNMDNCHNPVNMGFDEFYGLPFSNIRECGKNWTVDGNGLQHPVHENIVSFVKYCVVFALLLIFMGISSKRAAIIFLIVSIVLGIIAVIIEAILCHHFYCVLMRGPNVVEQPVVLDNLTVKFTDEANDFIHRNKNGPFLLFMSYIKVHTALFNSPKFKGHSVHGHYGDNVEEMDWSVGEIVSKLEEESILDNTFVYFTSDHGPWLEEILPSGEYHGGWRGNYRGGKSQNWEGGIRVPTTVTWKGHIPPGIVINEPTNTMDIFTTMAELAGTGIPNDRVIDGKNILPLLKQEQSISPHQFMFHYCGSEIHAVRYRPRTGEVTLKAHFITPKWASGRDNCFPSDICGCSGEAVNIHDPPLLYDITNDPYERNQLDPSLKKHKHIIIKIKEAMKQHQLGVKPVANQLSNSWWNARLQPCCNFPFCSCSDK